MMIISSSRIFTCTGRYISLYFHFLKGGQLTRIRACYIPKTTASGLWNAVSPINTPTYLALVLVSLVMQMLVCLLGKLHHTDVTTATLWVNNMSQTKRGQPLKATSQRRSRKCLVRKAVGTKITCHFSCRFVILCQRGTYNITVVGRMSWKYIQ